MTIKHHNPKFLGSPKIALDSNKFKRELDEATYALGLLEGSQRKLQNPSLLISPLSAKEATVSSRIEGTISTISDVFLYEAGGKPEHTDSAQVSNYRKAIKYAMQELQGGREISHSLINSLHTILLRGVRRKGSLGKYRKDLVYIGKLGDKVEKASYIPPEFILVQSYMDDLIKYIKENPEISLIKAGLAHYQFEAVHPFNDGNGRLGRLLVPLIFYAEKKLSSPILYLSGFFDENRDEYIDRLHEVDETGEYDSWLAFFLRGVKTQAEATQYLIDQIYQLFDDTRQVFEVTKSPYLVPFVEFIFEQPYFTIAQLIAHLNGTYVTANRLITLFKEKKIIEEASFKLGNQKIYVFRPLIKLLN
jgi:Fic family protein